MIPTHPFLKPAMSWGALALTLALAGVARAQEDPLAESGESWALFRLHCASCHGERGRGDGPAGRFLDPSPRNFVDGPFRFVSTMNGRPSDKDLFEVIGAGLPGTAMLPFAHLGQKDVTRLVSVVRALHVEGTRAAYAEDVTDPKELDDLVRAMTQPSGPIPRTAEPVDTVESRARGRLHFTRLCAACHGTDGRGTAMPVDPDSPEAKIPPRDLTQGVLKGGSESASLFARIRAGMPGSAMPSVPPETLDDSGVWDVIHYLRALMPPGAQDLHVAQGQHITVPRLDGALPTKPDDPRFAAAPEYHLTLAPFRASEWTVRSLTVRALHDGVHVVFQAQWADSTRNIPATDHPFPPDGLAARLTEQRHPPVLPIPGLPLPLDRALWLAGQMPEDHDPVFDHTSPRFENPDRVCVSPIGPEPVGTAVWRDRVWTALFPIQGDRGGQVKPGGTLNVSFAIFDGALRRGPLPAAFSPWHTLRFQ